MTHPQLTTIAPFLHVQLCSAMSSSLVWLREYQRNRDASSQRCAMFALGKVSGLYGALLVLYGGEDQSPEALRISEICSRCYDAVARGEPIDDLDAIEDEFKIRPLPTVGATA